ncbi:MAG TPA: CNNM domain-containing protein [Mariprofundaceae bacterium]|nr:CNNM domain-containing protein [Mariprofundaceae bacterium]
MDDFILSIPASIGILFMLLMVSAFFSGSETALTRASRPRLKTMQENRVRGAKRALELVRHPERMLAAVLLGNNFVNIAASSLATAVLVSYFGEAGIIYATVLMTTVVLIVSEILPKAIAVAHAEAIAVKVAPVLFWTQRLLSPVIAVLMAMIGVMRRFFRMPATREPIITHQELATLIDMGAKGGMLDSSREQMLLSSLRLHEVNVRALMSPRKNMIMIDAERSVGECLAYAMAKPHSRYPVYHKEPDNLIGIVHLRDLMRLKNRDIPLVQAVIWQTPMFIPSSKNALDMLFEFQTRRQHMAIVVDEFGDIDGLITLEDILEEIVGEITDEWDIPEQPDMWHKPDGSLVAEAMVSIHDVNDELGCELPKNEATTIGGLIVQMLGEQPDGPVCLAVDDVRLEVTELSGGWIQRVRITLNPSADEEAA